MTAIASLIVIALMLVACSGNNGNNNSLNNNGQQQPGNQDQQQGEEVTQPLEISLTLMGGPKTPNSWLKGALEEDLTAHLGREVTIEDVFLPSWGDMYTKVNLLMSDMDEMPDVIWFPSMDQEFKNWSDNGLLHDMTPLLQKHGNNILNYYSKDTLYYSWDPSGKIYRLPGDVAEAGSMTTILRKDWLDNLGLNVPSTLDEYIDVLRAFTHDDPDGNGQPDTFGITGDNNYRSFTPFFYAYGVDPESFIIQEDGTVKFGATMPEVREVLEILQGLSNEGVIDPRMLTSIEESMVEEIISQGKVGSVYRWIAYFNPDNSVQRSFKAINPDGEYIQIDPVAGPNGFASDRPSEVNGWAFLGITAAAEEPEAAMQVLDRIASPEVYKLITFGKEGEHYELVDGQYVSLIEPDEMNNLGLRNYDWYISRKDEANIQNSPEVIDMYARAEQTSMPMREKIAYFKGDDRPVWEEYGTDILTLRDTTFWGIIAGTLPITAFDDFVEQYYQLNGAEIDQEATELYQQEAEAIANFEAWYDENIEPYK